jgi:hypothetical protein
MQVYFDSLTSKIGSVNEKIDLTNIPCNQGVLDFNYGFTQKISFTQSPPPTYEILDGEMLRIYGTYIYTYVVPFHATKFYVRDDSITNVCYDRKVSCFNLTLSEYI